MSYTLEAIKKKPLGYWSLDTTNTLTDLSGYGNNATATGTRAKAYPLAYGMNESSVCTSSYTHSFPNSNLMRQGYEYASFTLTANVRPFSGTKTYETQQVFSSSSAYDGLTVNGSVVNFTLRFTNEDDLTLSYDTQIIERMHIAAIYNVERIALWINGVSVGEQELTPEQNADLFYNTGTTFSTGLSPTGTQSLQINGVGFYPRALSGTEIGELSDASARYDNTNNVENMYGGEEINIAQRSNTVFLRQELDTDEEWSIGQLSGVAINEDRLVPTFESDISLPGYWLGAFNLGTALTSTIYGVNINWDGVGAVVEVSLDGTTWEAVYRGKNVASVPAGTVPTDKNLLVRVTFPGGQLNDESYVSNLTLVGFNTGVSPELNNRTLTYTGALDLNEDYPVNSFNDTWGVTSKDVSGQLSIDCSTLPVKTVEVWVKATGSITNPFLNTPFGADTIYTNGVVGYYLHPKGVWLVTHHVKAAGFTGSLALGTTGNQVLQIGKVVVYDDALTATDIANIYKSYTGQSVLKAPDNSVVTITEPATAGAIYAHDWTILGSG